MSSWQTVRFNRGLFVIGWRFTGSPRFGPDDPRGLETTSSLGLSGCCVAAADETSEVPDVAAAAAVFRLFRISAVDPVGGP